MKTNVLFHFLILSKEYMNKLILTLIDRYNGYLVGQKKEIDINTYSQSQFTICQ